MKRSSMLIYVSDLISLAFKRVGEAYQKVE